MKLAPDGYDASLFVNGRLIECYTSTTAGPPRMMGDGCGCVRRRLSDRTWVMTFCDKHSKELTEKGWVSS